MTAMPSLTKMMFFLLKQLNIGIIGLLLQDLGKYRERHKIQDLIGIIGRLDNLLWPCEKDINEWCQIRTVFSMFVRVRELV